SGGFSEARLKVERQHQGRPSSPYGSSATQRAVEEHWKSSGPVVSCCGRKAVKLRQLVRWSLHSRLHRNKDHGDVELAHFVAGGRPSRAPAGAAGRRIPRGPG